MYLVCLDRGVQRVKSRKKERNATERVWKDQESKKSDGWGAGEGVEEKKQKQMC